MNKLATWLLILRRAEQIRSSVCPDPSCLMGPQNYNDEPHFSTIHFCHRDNIHDCGW